MGTRCTINFGDIGNIDSKIFRHWDGYPDVILPDLQDFFTEVRRQTTDTRFNDASILASRFVVWLSRQFVTDAKYKIDPKSYERLPGDGITNDNYLNFLSVRVDMIDSGDIEYTYYVDCANFDENGFPTVSHREATDKDCDGKFKQKWKQRANAKV